MKRGTIKMLEIKNVKKSFGTHQVLKGVSFSVNSGQIYGLIGKNGAGKTTLLNIIANLLTADNGECLIHPIVSTQSRQIGYLPDIPSFFSYLSSKEYIDFLLINCNNRMTSEKRNTLLKLVGLNGTEKIQEMSRGMKQRLGIAAVLVLDPPVLLLDEPTSALDPTGRYELLTLLNELKSRGKCIILSTHILADMERICDRVGFLHAGVIQKEINIHELRAGNQYAWEVSFENQIELPYYNKEVLAISKNGPNNYTFETVEQKYLLSYLLKIPSKIKTIYNKCYSLDNIFKEVCK